MRRVLYALFFFLAACASAKMNATGKARGLNPHRVDRNTSGSISRMQHSSYTSATCWLAFSYDDGGTTHYDLTSYKNNAAQSTAAYRPSFDSTYGGCLQFDGPNSNYVSIADNADMEPDPHAGWTFAAWVKLDGTGVYGFIVSKSFAADNTRGPQIYWEPDGNLVGYLYEEGDGTPASKSTTSNAFTVTNWHHVAVAWSSNQQIKIYVDGSEEGCEHVGPIDYVVDHGNNWIIGAHNKGTSTYLDGRISEVGFWERKLSAAEIADLYNKRAAYHQ